MRNHAAAYGPQRRTVTPMTPKAPKATSDHFTSRYSHRSGGDQRRDAASMRSITESRG